MFWAGWKSAWGFQPVAAVVGWSSKENSEQVELPAGQGGTGEWPVTSHQSSAEQSSDQQGSILNPQFNQHVNSLKLTAHSSLIPWQIF